ncbi:hypothetical protein PSR1_01635 [Anaeromyxobacter sp. PSR-1]|nr:hypothetical protein PSR1_01635 [Anaeromyxobacter sp. PSR-1]
MAGRLAHAPSFGGWRFRRRDPRKHDAPSGPVAGGAPSGGLPGAGCPGYFRLFAISAMRSQPLSICSIEVANDRRM